MLFFYDAATSAAGFIPQSRGSSRVLWVRENDLVAALAARCTPGRTRRAALGFEVEYTAPRRARGPDDRGALSTRSMKRRRTASLPEDSRANRRTTASAATPRRSRTAYWICQLATNGIEAGSPEALATAPGSAGTGPAGQQRLAAAPPDRHTDDDGPDWSVGRLRHASTAPASARTTSVPSASIASGKMSSPGWTDARPATTSPTSPTPNRLLPTSTDRLIPDPPRRSQSGGADARSAAPRRGQPHRASLNLPRPIPA